jgi:hypothetical protein
MAVVVEARFVKSKRGKDQLYYDGFLLNFDQNIGAKSIWRCVKYQKSQTSCRARIHIDENGDILECSQLEHNHPGQAAQVKGREKVQQMKAIALTNPNLNPKAIVAQTAPGISDAVASEMPLVRSITRGIRQARSKANTGQKQPNPASITDFEIPDNLRYLETGESFLLSDSGKNDVNRIIMFGTKKGMKKLKIYKEWYMDGCFRIGKRHCFEQLYIIYSKRNFGIYPGVYVLLQNKQEATYTKMLEEVKTFHFLWFQTHKLSTFLFFSALQIERQLKP